MEVGAMNTIKLPQNFYITPSQFAKLVTANDQVRLELTAEGELVVMPPTGGEATHLEFSAVQGFDAADRRQPTGVGV